MSFAGRHKSAHTHTHTELQTHKHRRRRGARIHTHTLLRLPFLQAMAPLILSDLKFVCSLLQRAPSMIPSSLRAPLRYHPSTFISLTLLSGALLRREQLPDYACARTHVLANTYCLYLLIKGLKHNGIGVNSAEKRAVSAAVIARVIITMKSTSNDV